MNEGEALFISGGPNSFLGFIGLELDRLLLSWHSPPDMTKGEVTLVHGTRRGSTCEPGTF